jgi:hypothetical protein
MPLPALGLKNPWAASKLAHVARYNTALAEHLWAIWQRALHAYCSEGRHAVAGSWAEEPLDGLKAGLRRTKRNRAIQTPVDGTEACRTGLLRQGAPCRCRRLG